MSDALVAPKKPRATVASVREEVASERAKVFALTENLAQLKIALEDRNWQTLSGNTYEATGLDLDTIQSVSETLRGHIVGGALLKRIIELRGEMIYGDGVGFSGYSRARAAFENENNAAKLFSAEALQEVNRAHGTDGQVTFLVHKATKEIVRVPIAETRTPYVDSTDRERVWYFKRQYQRITPAKPQGETVTRYYVADTCPANENGRTVIDEGAGVTVEVDRNYTSVTWAVNRQVGWPLGIPDLLAALQWAEKYTGYLKNQTKFAEALATIAWQWKTDTTEDAKKVTARLRRPAETGASSVGTPGIEAKPMTGASDVSFANGRPLAAQAAASVGITIEGVLGDSLNGAGSTLDPHEKNTARARRSSATAFFGRIGRLLNAPNLKVHWPDLESESPFREAQMVIAAWNSGLFDPEELRPTLADRLRVPLTEGSTAPDGVLIPNNENSLAKTTAANTPETPDDDTVDANTNAQGRDRLGVGKLSDGDNTARDNGENPGS